MSDLPPSDVSRPSALPTANLLRAAVHPLVDQNSAEFLDGIEEEWNKKVDAEVDTLVDGMVDLVSLASIADKDKFRIAQEAFQAQSRAESMASPSLSIRAVYLTLAPGPRGQLAAVHHPLHEAAASPFG
ncbi:hypothetical protein AX14_011759 [Amanita brunnescens Koide BX004]|nr:hypothetical protein AX14_011759 [Amanita brunnescens Koide BX004]